jgi:hypothetical protein
MVARPRPSTLQGMSLLLLGHVAKPVPPPPPPPPCRFPYTERPPTPKAQRVTSCVLPLHHIGGPYRNCVGATYGGMFKILETSGGSSAPAKTTPKAEFKAHDVAVTALASNPLNPCYVMTGAQDGCVHMWNLRDRPGQVCGGGGQALRGRTVCGLLGNCSLACMCHASRHWLQYGAWCLCCSARA